jgi:hypothetical protein
MNMFQSTEYMVSVMNASDSLMFVYGRFIQIVSSVCMLLHLLMKRFFVYMEGLSPNFHSSNQNKNIPRNTNVPDHGILCDIIWVDPVKDIKG